MFVLQQVCAYICAMQLAYLDRRLSEDGCRRRDPVAVARVLEGGELEAARLIAVAAPRPPPPPQDELVEGAPEVLVEDGVDHRVAARVGVRHPEEEAGDVGAEQLAGELGGQLRNINM